MAAVAESRGPPSAADRPGRRHSRPLAPVSRGPGARAPPGRRTRAGTAPRRRGRRARSVGRRGGVPMMPVLITCHRRVCSLEGVPVPGYRPGSLPAVFTSVRPAGGTAASQEEEQAAPSLPRRRDRGVLRATAAAEAAGTKAGAASAGEWPRPVTDARHKRPDGKGQDSLGTAAGRDPERAAMGRKERRAVRPADSRRSHATDRRDRPAGCPRQWGYPDRRDLCW